MVFLKVLLKAQKRTLFYYYCMLYNYKLASGISNRKRYQPSLFNYTKYGDRALLSE